MIIETHDKMTPLEKFVIKNNGELGLDFADAKFWLKCFVREVMNRAKLSENPPQGDVVGAHFIELIKEFKLLK